MLPLSWKSTQQNSNGNLVAWDQHAASGQCISSVPYSAQVYCHREMALAQLAKNILLCDICDIDRTGIKKSHSSNKMDFKGAEIMRE